MSESNKLLRTIFNEAVEIADAEQRADYLAIACRDSAELRDQVEALIAAHHAAGEFLGPAGDTLQSEAATVPGGSGNVVQLGEHIGRYKLLQQIGEGGCGVVFMAEQEQPIRRRVALKVIKLGMDTKSVIARFEAERQALALMDHPNIAKVLDAGATDAGRPYFVMELVKGVRITDYCDQNHLPTAARLDLFMQVCHAIQHAHQKGIIHRDIKPSNILVTLHDGVPVPKVIDFGIAKATDQRLTEKTVFTEFQAFMGTPAYMSPEQAEMSGLDIDTRSDIYALGVLLYELLTGHTPFDGKELLAAGLDEMRRTLREQEPAKPSTRLSTMLASDLTTVARHRRCEPAKLTSSICGDLDWIVMKALEKDRTRRYDTANAFALDIRRFLADEPVSAAAPTAAYRFGKFARRNKTALAIATAFAAILIAATVVSTWQAIRVSRERDAKDKARQEAEAIATFLSDIFSSPDPAQNGRTITVAETLDRAAKKLETDLAMHSGPQAYLQFNLGETYRALGLAREATPLQEKARAYYLATFGLEHSNTVATMIGLATSYFDAGRRPEALRLREETLRLSRKAFGTEHPCTLAAMNNLARSYSDAGRRDEAIKLLEEALPLVRKVHGPEHRDTLAMMGGLAISYADGNRRDEALVLREKTLALFRKVNDPEHPDTLKAMMHLADSYADANRPDEALKLREEVLPLNRKVLGLKHPDTLAAMNELANSYSDAHRRQEALQLREEALLLYRKTLGLEHPDTLTAMSLLASSFADVGRPEEALKLREETLTLSRKVNSPEDPDTIGAIGNLANSYFNAGRRPEALQLHEAALTLLRKVRGPEHSETLAEINNLANSYADAGRSVEALKLREEMLMLSRKALGPENPTTLMAMGNLALYHLAHGHLDEAIELRKEMLAVSRKAFGPKHPDTLQALKALAEIYIAKRRHLEAEPLVLEVNEIMQQDRKADPADQRETIELLGKFYTDWAVEAPGTGKMQKALEWNTKLRQFDEALRQQTPAAK